MRSRAVTIRAVGSISALGNDQDVLSVDIESQRPQFDFQDGVPVFRIPRRLESELSNPELFGTELPLDRAVRLGVYAASRAYLNAGWERDPLGPLGVVVGTSRGSAGSYEESLGEFLTTGRCPNTTSPTTTMGVFSSSIIRALKLNSLNSSLPIDLSMTCSSGFVSLLVGISLLESGACRRVLVGGAEAPLTDFTIAQMRSLGIYTKETGPFPCRPLDSERDSTFCLGEGAAFLALELTDEVESESPVILGWGSASEVPKTATGITRNGEAFQSAMRQALTKFEERLCLNAGEGASRVDLLVPHAPGTRLGDRSELEAIKAIFGESMPRILNGKWLTGHTFGASGLLGLEFGRLVSQAGKSTREQTIVQCNTTGFGGLATSILYQDRKRC